MRYVGHLMNGEKLDWAQMLRILDTHETADDLSAKWPEDRYDLTWHMRWKKLWGRGGLTRTKLWTWRILRRAFFTGERAEAMQVALGTCCKCKAALETTSHLFYECSHSQSQWRQLMNMTRRAQVSFRVTNNLLQLVDEALITKAKGGTLIYTCMA
ncbi:hypothetical protein R1flu_020813 [Riccia fluitans]|uniref:Reverse transcriptase zinc-binding domain-containing protein n=1 Tax=Riccia fluitans TaxID=41844 RepID=A0ABD1ZP37_9MARC